MVKRVASYAGVGLLLVVGVIATSEVQGVGLVEYWVQYGIGYALGTVVRMLQGLFG